jgi:fibronectin-binding autotransporter adhesin
VALTIANNGAPALYAGTLNDTATSGATLTINGSGSQQIGSGSSGGATYTGTTLINAGTLILGGNTALTGTFDVAGLNGVSTAIVQDAATITTSSALRLADAPGSGTYPSVSTLTLLGSANVSAPSFSFGNTTRVPSSFVNISGNAILNIAGDFELNSSEGSTAENNVVSLNGGTLAVGNFTLTEATVGTHQATLNFNGGVLEANASDPSGSTFLPALTALTVNVLSNGVTVNPNGNNITIAAVLPGAGGLTNIGTGTLNLSAANTYTGNTFITNGATLNVINTSGSGTGTGNVTVGSGGTLEGTGIITGSVTWQTGALATFTTGSSPTPLTVGVVTLNNNTVTINVPGTALTVGSYTLMNYTAAGSTGTFNPTPIFTGSGVASGTTSSISTIGGVVTLTVSPVVTANVWNVDADGSWTTAANWSGNPTIPGNPGDAAELGIGSALRTVTLNANESLGYLEMTNANSFVVANGGHTLTLDNSGNGAYVTVSGGSANAIQTAVSLNDNSSVVVNSGDLLTISGVIASTSSSETLTLLGTGTLVLGNANTYGPAQGTIGTIIEGGTLQVGNNNALGAGDVSFAGNGTLQSVASGLTVTNNLTVSSGATATLDDNGNTFTLGGVFSGGGIYAKIGAGTLLLTNNNSFSGALNINNGKVIITGDNSSSGGGVTNSATLQLASANAVASSVLTLGEGSTLQLRADANTLFNLSSLALKNPTTNLTFDVNSLTGATSNVLTLNSGLSYPSLVNAVINVTGGSGYTLGLGAIAMNTVNTAPHRPFTLNVVTNISVVIAGFTSQNWGNDIVVQGGGNVTFTGNLANTSNGSDDLYVNGGTTVTLQGASVKTATGDAYSYFVNNGTLVLDNSAALINDTTGPGANQSYFFLGTSNNASAVNPANCAVYLGDANNNSGGLTLAASVTNYVSDGGAFTNTGTFTIGGQNTSGDNTYADPIVLGWTTNLGKSVTLVAATGGEVDFTGGILANGTDQTAGITVGDATHAGYVKLTGADTYRGNTTVNGGTLEIDQATLSTNSTVSVTNGATLNLGFSGVNIVNALVLNGVSKPAGTYSSGNTALIFGSGSLQVVVQTPVLRTAPTASAIVYGQTLGASTLTGGLVVNGGGLPVAGTFAFASPSTAPGAGTASQSVTFTPSNANSYNPITFNVSVTVGKATPVLQAAPTASAIVYGQTLASSSFSGGTVTNALGAGVSGSYAFTTPSTAPGAGTASQPVTFTPTDTTDYNSIALNVNVTVNPQVPVLQVAPTAQNITNGQALSASVLSGGSVTNAAGAPVAGTVGVNGFAFTTPSATPGVGTANQSVTFTPTDNTDYTSITLNVSVTVVAPAAVTAVQFTAKPVISGTSLTISGTNTGAGTIYLLTSTNVASHLSTWTPIWTNTLSGSSSFTTNLSNAVNPAQNHNFYILSTTNN